MSTDVETRIEAELVELNDSIAIRLDWLEKCARGDHDIRNQIQIVRDHLNQVSQIQNGKLTAVVAMLNEAIKQRDGYKSELSMIELDLLDIDNAQHPLIKSLTETVQALAKERADDLAEMLFTERYESIIEDSQEYAEESVWDAIGELMADELDVYPVEALDILHLFTGLSGDVMTDDHVGKFHQLLGEVREHNQRRRNATK